LLTRQIELKTSLIFKHVVFFVFLLTSVIVCFDSERGANAQTRYGTVVTLSSVHKL